MNRKEASCHECSERQAPLFVSTVDHQDQTAREVWSNYAGLADLAHIVPVCSTSLHIM